MAAMEAVILCTAEKARCGQRRGNLGGKEKWEEREDGHAG